MKRMNKTVGSKKSSGTLFPKQLVVDDFEIFHQKVITESFNYFFREVRPKLASKIPQSLKVH